MWRVATGLVSAVVVLAGCTGGSDEAEDVEIEDGRGLERDVRQLRAVVRDDFLARGLEPSTVRCDVGGGAMCFAAVGDIGYDVDVDEQGEIEILERHVVSPVQVENREVDGLDPLEAFERWTCDVPLLAAEVGAQQSCGHDAPDGAPGWTVRVTEIQDHDVTVEVDEH